MSDKMASNAANSELLAPVSFDEFEKPTYEKWQAEVEKALKGGDFHKKMFTKTYEGITLQPIYTPALHQEKIPKGVYPGAGQFLRGTKASGYIKDSWGVSQYVDESLPKDANHASLYEIVKGSTIHNIRLDEATRHDQDVQVDAAVGEGGTSLSTVEDCTQLLERFNFKENPLYIEAGASSAILLGMISATVKATKKQTSDLKGLVGADPIGVWVKDGTLHMSLDTAFDEMAHSVIWASEQAPQLKTVLISGDAYANGGANDVQEVAYALATAACYVRQLAQRNVDIHTIANSMMFTFSLGANFFMEIAKLRALRVIWARIMEAFGADESDRAVHVHGRTSAFTKTVYDPYVNLLRNTTQAFSGVVGGLDSLEVSPFDQPIRKSDDFSRRIARNIQVMLQTEFELRQPVDPVGGSWYVETLAAELCEKIWAEFQTIEAKGGIVAALKEGYPQVQVKAVLAERFENLAYRKDVAVGNNMYANMTEELLDPKPENQDTLRQKRTAQIEAYLAGADPDAVAKAQAALEASTTEPGALIGLIELGALQKLTMRQIRKALDAGDISSETIEAITPHRWTEQFEALRMRTEEYKQRTKDNVKVFLANMGPIPQHKPRADFSTGFFEVAAFEVIKNDGHETTADAAKAARESGADVVVICSTDATYPELVPPLAKELKETMPNVTVILAGAPPKDLEPTYREAGVDDFISVRANCYEILHTLQDKKGM
ncbi:methylmalonyl-CoA mutase family protein [Veillonella rodentium]|uniref:Methylmalonyl-CoA mutase n=1 Tax=Veillonella rodentium TaxID=248315 RepID=A0A239ZXH2_9FIRM|nr:methylmalonyl-CoA mutase family protein [Veillonella rodentium]SNV75911.1 Methylmalonyl-CoA mutase [Veillonella rodentium]